MTQDTKSLEEILEDLKQTFLVEEGMPLREIDVDIRYDVVVRKLKQAFLAGQMNVIGKIPDDIFITIGSTGTGFDNTPIKVNLKQSLLEDIERSKE